MDKFASGHVDLTIWLEISLPHTFSLLWFDAPLVILERGSFGLSSEGESDFEEEGVYGYMPEADHDLLPAIASFKNGVHKV